MLELKNVVKEYTAGTEMLPALRGVSMSFRKNEFVSILGPSGCGKTTLLNIIGGLDQYTSGDLIINGVSTRDFRDGDWDAYRNHSIGFVFQSYNLIPHQTVLQNVELALTLSGVSKAERRRRATEALKAVGLASQLHKRPGEMSGGQMQRVAIARAIVNDPDIILADEPTGALDTETSIQVMEILKEIARDRLIIMVTHNPDLAERYSTRIIRLLDGQLVSDSAPLSEQEQETERQGGKETGIEKKHKKRPSMSYATAFGLSLKNLFTKKGRTILTSFAGSIGIIGIALILSVSQGMTNYINTVQEETLSSYPLTLEKKHVDIGTLLETFMSVAKSSSDHGNDAVYQKSMIYDMINSLSSLDETQNDLAGFKQYLEERLADPEDASGLRKSVTGVQYGYDLDILVYTETVDGTVIRSDTTELMQKLLADYMGMNYSSDASATAGASPFSSLMATNRNNHNLWQEMLPGNDGSLINPLFNKQYDVVYGSWPSAYNEIVLVLDENNELDDMTLYALGLLPKEKVDAIMDAAANKKELESDNLTWSYADICQMEFHAILNSDCYTKDEKTGLYTDLRDSDAGIRYLYANGTKLKVSGIIRPKKDALSTILTGSIGYTNKLTEYVIEKSKDSPAVKAQQEDVTTDIFTGLPFKDGTDDMADAAKAKALREYLNSLTTEKQAESYVRLMSIPSQQQLNASIDQVLGTMSIEQRRIALQETLTEQMSMDAAAVKDYLDSMSDDAVTSLFTEGVENQVKKQYAEQVSAQMKMMNTAQLASALQASLPTYTDEQCAIYYDEVLDFSESDLETNLQKLGYVDLSAPSTVNLYASSFEAKDDMEDAIADYNEGKDDMHRIAYTDYVGIIMSSVTTIINAITYVLIAFVAISLIVSSIMIGVITLISVQERTKEIGILRALGASKRNVSHMFNAETVIIGFASGLLGVLVTYLLCIPINLLLHNLTGIGNLNAVLPPMAAGVLVLVSMLLTLVAGIIPSRSAAKKDPVVALRTE